MLKILILFSDTGGGHRAAAEALRDALNLHFGDQAQTTMEDAIVNAAISPFHLVPRLYYPTTSYIPGVWGFLFNSTNSRWGQRLVSWVTFTLLARGLRRIIERVQPDVVVTVHPLLTIAPWRVCKGYKPNAPFVTVVTDLFDAHAMWFAAPSDLLVVPTAGARERGVRWGFPPDKMRVVGLPVSRKFAEASCLVERDEAGAVRSLRTRLGLSPDLFTVLVVGGGEGMGPLQDIVRALSNASLPIQVVAIAGRNRALKRKLETESWPVPVCVTGFVTNMPDWMAASDLVITKAGPGTIMEALTVGRPLLISGYLPGQEKGNVDFVEQSGAGVYCERPEVIAEQVRRWLSPGDHSLAKLRARACAQARPNAASDIAILLDQLMRGSPKLTRCEEGSS